MQKTIRAALLCIAASALALAAQDVKIAYRTESKTIMTESKAVMAESKGTQVEYHSKRYMLTKDDKEKRDTLIDYSGFVAYAIDHKKKVIGKTALEDVIKAIDLAAAELEGIGGNDEMIKSVMKSLFGEEKTAAAVKKVGTERIAGRNCEKWDITLGKFSCKVSADPSLVPPANPDALEKVKKLKGSALLTNPMMGKTFGKFFDAMQNIKGVQLKSDVVTSIGPITTRESREATAVEQGPIPASLFELPNYRQEDVGKKMVADLEKGLKKKK